MPISDGRRSEAELGSDVYRLAVLLRRLRQGRKAITLLRIAHAGGDIEVAGETIAARNVDRLVASSSTAMRAANRLSSGRAPGEGRNSARSGMPASDNERDSATSRSEVLAKL